MKSKDRRVQLSLPALNSCAMMIILLCLVILLTALSGCTGSARGAGPKDDATDFMAWQFAQGVVRQRVPRPNNATYPRFQPSFVERKDDNLFIISSRVNTVNAEGEIISYNFVVEAEYVSKDVFVERSVELRKN